jgi:hypothetical protein
LLVEVAEDFQVQDLEPVAVVLEVCVLAQQH